MSQPVPPSTTLGAVHDYVARNVGAPNVASRVDVQELASHDRDTRHFRATVGTAAYRLTLYRPSARERARHVLEGLRFCGDVGLAPALVAADMEERALGGPAVLSTEAAGPPLSARPLTEGDRGNWLFLLLTMHHLNPQAVAVASPTTANVGVWWQQVQPMWNACRATYGDAQYAPLMAQLARLHTIAHVRITAHRALWATLPARACHGDPTPQHVISTAGRLTLVGWDLFGLGDPAIDFGRAAASMAIAGYITSQQHGSLTSDYLAGMRDPHDRGLAERLDVFSSVAPFECACQLLAELAVPAEHSRRSAIHTAGMLRAALGWLRDRLMVDIGDVNELLAPWRGHA